MNMRSNTQWTLTNASALAIIGAAMTGLPMAAHGQAATPSETVPTPQATDTDAGQLASSDVPVADLVVTGSRLGSSFNAPTPVTSIGAERLSALGINNVGEALNQPVSYTHLTLPTICSV